MRPKFIVRVKTASGEYKKAKHVTEDGYHIVMNKGNKKTAFWGFSFTRASVIPVRIFFGLFKRDAIDVFQDAEKAIDYNFDALSIDAPAFDKATENRFLKGKALELLNRSSEVKQPLIFWIMLMLGVINTGLIFMVCRRIGIF
jgi:hypothetical protein